MNGNCRRVRRRSVKQKIRGEADNRLEDPHNHILTQHRPRETLRSLAQARRGYRLGQSTYRSQSKAQNRIVVVPSLFIILATLFYASRTRTRSALAVTDKLQDYSHNIT